MNKRLFAILSVLVLASIMLAACGPKVETSSDPAYTGPQVIPEIQPDAKTSDMAISNPQDAIGEADVQTEFSNDPRLAPCPSDYKVYDPDELQGFWALGNTAAWIVEAQSMQMMQDGFTASNPDGREILVETLVCERAFHIKITEIKALLPPN